MYPEWKWGVRWGEKMMRERWSDSYCVRIFRPLSPCKYPPYYPHIINAKKIIFDGGKLCAPFAFCAFPVLAPPLPVRPCFPRQSFAPFPLFDFAPLSLSFPKYPPFTRSPVPLSFAPFNMSQRIRKRGTQKQKFFIYQRYITPNR